MVVDFHVGAHDILEGLETVAVVDGVGLAMSVSRIICGTAGCCGSGVGSSLLQANSKNAANARSIKVFVCFMITKFLFI